MDVLGSAPEYLVVTKIWSLEIPDALIPSPCSSSLPYTVLHVSVISNDARSTLTLGAIDMSIATGKGHLGQPHECLVSRLAGHPLASAA